MRKVNLKESFNLFDDYWSPKIAGSVNDTYVKLVKFKGEFVWHHHEPRMRCSGGQRSLLIRFRDRDIRLKRARWSSSRERRASTGRR